MASVLTAANWPIVGQLCWVLGKVMNFIYNQLYSLGITHGTVGWSIIIYTIFVYTIMIPITIKQQKSSKMTAVINPEIQAIQKKYKNKKDQDSMMRQQEEIQAVYDKYGTSMMSGCLPLLIQMPLLFALYPVIYSIENYVPAIKTAPESVQQFLTFPNLQQAPLAMLKSASSYGTIAPALIIISCIALPVLSGATQLLNIKLNQAIMNPSDDKDNPMASSMKTMNVTMPLFSVFMVFTLSAGIGVYWVVSAVIRCIQQVVINRRLANIDLDALVEQNKEKAAKKAAKRKERNDQIAPMANTKTKSMKSKAIIDDPERQARLDEARKNIKPGSLASKANMVNDFNNRKNKK